MNKLFGKSNEDKEVEAHFEDFLKWLQANNLPLPERHELRIIYFALMWEQCKEYQQKLRNNTLSVFWQKRGEILQFLLEKEKSETKPENPGAIKLEVKK